MGYLSIGNLGRYQFSGGTLQVDGGGLANQGVFDATRQHGRADGRRQCDRRLLQGPCINTGSMSLSIGPNSLLLVPAGFNPATAFGSYSNLGLTHNVGTPLTILPGQGFSGNGSIADLVNCQGTISAAAGGSINLNGGVTVSGTGNVNLGSGSFTVNDALSGITGGSLSAGIGYVGYSGTGTFTQSGGTNNLGSFGTSGLYLGYNAGSSGSYNLSGSGVLSAYDEYVGYSGTGTFTQSGGTNNVTVACGFTSATTSGSSGSYNLSGSGLLSAYLRVRGLLRHRHVYPVRRDEQSSAATGSLYLGYNAGSSGSYNLSGSGVLIRSDTSTWATPAPARLPSPVGQTTSADCQWPLPRLQRGLQRQLQPQRLRSALRPDRVRGLLRHRHVYAVRRDEQSAARHFTSATTRFQRQLQPQRLGSALRIPLSTWATPARARSPSPAGRTILALASMAARRPLPRLQLGFQRQLQPQRHGSALRVL